MLEHRTAVDIYYEKASLVMYLLQDRMGEERINRALRTMIERYAFKGPPFPTSLDLIAALREEALPDQQELITDLFERITLYDLKLTEAGVQQRDDGRFDVTLAVEAHKLYSDGTGQETEAPIGESEVFDVGLFLAEPGRKDFGRDDVLRLERMHLASGAQRLTLTVDRMPAFAGVDPWAKQIDRKSDDNIIAVAR